MWAESEQSWGLLTHGLLGRLGGGLRQAREGWAAVLLGRKRGPRTHAVDASGRVVVLPVPEQGRGRVAAADGAGGELASTGRHGAVPAGTGRSGPGDPGSGET